MASARIAHGALRMGVKSIEDALILNRVPRRSQLRNLPDQPVNIAVPSVRHLRTSSVLPKSRRSQSSSPPPEVVDEVPVIRTKGKGAKGASSTKRGAKSKSGQNEDVIIQDTDRERTTTTNADLEGEVFEEAKLKQNMDRTVSRCRETVAKLVGSHGRADPAILDNVRVTIPLSDSSNVAGPKRSTGSTYGIKEFATVGVRDGALIVTCFDPESVKHVERAIYTSDLGLAPQHVPGTEEGVLRVPVPRPTSESRQKLIADVNRICENARISIRTARQIAQKQIRNDVRNGVVGKDEGNREMKKMEDATKSHTTEVDKLQEQMKQRIEHG